MALVNPPRYLQNKTYSAFADRTMLQYTSSIQQGVVNIGVGTPFKVTQRAAGANMSADVAAGWALSQGLFVDQGYYLIQNDATVNVAVTASNATNPRIDQLILEIHDSTDIGSSDDTSILRVLAGTPTAGATLDNRNGAVSRPANSLLLADILVPAASSSVTTANIRDRRPWARGAYFRGLKSGSATTLSGTFAFVDTATLQARIECTGMPLQLAIEAEANTSAASIVGIQYGVDVDGSVPTAVGGGGESVVQMQPSNVRHGALHRVVLVPSVGSHVFSVSYASYNGSAAVSLLPSGGVGIMFEIEELLRPSQANT